MGKEQAMLPSVAAIAVYASVRISNALVESLSGDMSPEEAQVCAALPDSSREQVAMAAAYGGQQTAQTVANRGLRRTKSSSKEESTVYMW